MLRPRDNGSVGKETIRTMKFVKLHKFPKPSPGTLKTRINRFQRRAKVERKIAVKCIYWNEVSIGQVHYGKTEAFVSFLHDLVERYEDQLRIVISP